MRLQASQHPPTARGHWETLRAVLWEWTDFRPIVQMEETETRVKSLSGATGQVKGRTGILMPRPLCHSLDCFSSPHSSPEETPSLKGCFAGEYVSTGIENGVMQHRRPAATKTALEPGCRGRSGSWHQKRGRGSRRDQGKPRQHLPRLPFPPQHPGPSKAAPSPLPLF